MSTVEAPIVAVTVYPQHARVTRRSRARAAGETRLTFAGLPVALDAESVRVTGTGPALITGVDVRTERHPEPADAAVHALVERRRTQQATVDEVEDELAAESAKTDLLSALARRAGTSFAKALAGGDTEPARVAEVSDALREQLAEALKGKRARTEQLTRLRDDLAALDREIAEHGQMSTEDSTSVAVELETTGEGQGEDTVELELSYVVPGASWVPGYDVRVHGTDVAVTSYALVTQHTGEDWPECDLALSTARPASTVTVPELQPWFLDRERPRPPMAPAGSAAPAGMPDMGRTLSFAASAPRMAARVAEVEQGATAATYRPARPVAIPSGAQGHRTTLAQLELTAELGYVTAPVLAEEAYLRAKVVNTTEHTLRPGRASVFHDAEFVGTTRLEPWAPGEEIELALGVDDRIRVERELTRRTAGKAALSGQRRREAEYRTTVTNHGPREATVTVLDQVPVSRDDAVTVRDVRTSPDPAESGDLGELSWRLALAPGGSAAVTLSFRVDVAKGVELSGWRE